MKKLSIKLPSDITYMFMILSDCINAENIENKERILKNLEIAQENIYSLPKDLRNEVNEFITKIINPIVRDKNYFDFIYDENYGYYDSEKHFIIESERGLENAMFLLYNHTIELHEKLLKVFAKHIK